MFGSTIIALFFAAFAGAAPLPEVQPIVATLHLLQEPHATVLFGGDMIFDRSIRMTADEKGGDFLFSCIDPLLRASDVVVANLEGPITEAPSHSVGSVVGTADNYVFTFPTSTAPLLAAHNIRFVDLGNNHILNFGSAGAASTVAALSAARVGYFGDPLAHAYTAASLNGVHVAFISYNEFGGNASTTIAQIREARNAGEPPVVFAHWGVEYATTSPARIHMLAHEFVDAGAAIVVGAHPHVVEEHELYHGIYIYYSLGNFIFDQYWDDAVSHGLMLQVTFDMSGVETLKEIPIVLDHDRRTCPLQ
jgi:poly-gamma-glutamate capsule biosynthesis protein CapA/YwtB (metallophosphatase superfamily)